MAKQIIGYIRSSTAGQGASVVPLVDLFCQDRQLTALQPFAERRRVRAGQLLFAGQLPITAGYF